MIVIFPWEILWSHLIMCKCVILWKFYSTEYVFIKFMFYNTWNLFSWNDACTFFHDYWPYVLLDIFSKYSKDTGFFTFLKENIRRQESCLFFLILNIILSFFNKCYLLNLSIYWKKNRFQYKILECKNFGALPNF